MLLDDLLLSLHVWGHRSSRNLTDQSGLLHHSRLLWLLALLPLLLSLLLHSWPDQLWFLLLLLLAWLPLLLPLLLLLARYALTLLLLKLQLLLMLLQNSWVGLWLAWPHHL